MAEFKIAFQKTLVHEGNYSNDVEDLGGETYKGISRTLHSDWEGWTMIDCYKSKPGFLTSLSNDIQLQKQVELFYWTNFWLPIKAYQILNQTIADSIFDFAVNAGIQTSIRLVQAIVEADVDGIIGNQTLNKLNACDPTIFLPAFTIAKIEYYVSLVTKRPLNQKYFYGWVIRALNYKE